MTRQRDMMFGLMSKPLATWPVTRVQTKPSYLRSSKLASPTCSHVPLTPSCRTSSMRSQSRRVQRHSKQSQQVRLAQVASLCRRAVHVRSRRNSRATTQERLEQTTIEAGFQSSRVPSQLSSVGSTTLLLPQQPGSSRFKRA